LEERPDSAQTELKGFQRVAKNLAPSWFAAVMGTGIFAVTSKYYSCYWSWLNNAAACLWAINIILFLVLLIPWIARWFLFTEDSLRDLNHPVTGQFYATMPIGCLVLAVGFLVVGTDLMNVDLAVGIAKVCWVSGAVLALLFAVVTPLLNFLNKVTLTDLNPAWFMPPVSLIVAPIAGAKLIPFWPLYLQKPLLLINYAFWGTGFFLFIFLAVICFYRLIAAPPLPGKLVPTVWIYLGPIGAGTLALLNLGAVSAPWLGNSALPVINTIGLIYWGFGFWWLIIAALVTLINILRKNLPYALSWWAFTFPLGAYAGATFLIAVTFSCPPLKLYGFICYCLLAICWLIVFSQTFYRVCTGELFKG
jgi:C4-dicarboxylate transporter/malic acid transport protein